MRINTSKIVKIGRAFLTKHAADILTGFTAAGVVITALETRKATLRAQEFLAINGYDQANPETQKVLKLEAAKNYILPVATGGLTIGAAVGANYINHKQIAGLAAACTVAETALSEHRDKLEELLGAKELGKVDDAVNSENMEKFLAKSNENDIYKIGDGKCLCCEGYLTGRLFYATPEFIRKCENEYNNLLLNDMYAAWADFLEMFWPSDEKVPEVANCMGHGIHKTGLLKLKFTSGLTDSGVPYLIFTPENPPIADFLDIFPEVKFDI